MDTDKVANLPLKSKGSCGMTASILESPLETVYARTGKLSPQGVQRHLLCIQTVDLNGT